MVFSDDGRSIGSRAMFTGGVHGTSCFGFSYQRCVSWCFCGRAKVGVKLKRMGMMVGVSPEIIIISENCFFRASELHFTLYVSPLWSFIKTLCALLVCLWWFGVHFFGGGGSGNCNGRLRLSPWSGPGLFLIYFVRCSIFIYQSVRSWRNFQRAQSGVLYTKEPIPYILYNTSSVCISYVLRGNF